MHFLPLLDGGGLVQVLALVFKQPWLLHLPQFPQTDQPPSTKIKETISIEPFGRRRFCRAGWNLGLVYHPPSTDHSLPEGNREGL